MSAQTPKKLNSAVGVLAPMYGGLLLSRLGVNYQPHLSCAHYVLLLVLAKATIARKTSTPEEAQSSADGDAPAAKASKAEAKRAKKVK